MTRPTRDTTAGRVYLDLRRHARDQGRGTDEMLVLYVLERFLYRLSISSHRDRFVLKGGMLLAALGERRPTRDVDLLALSLANDVASVTSLVSEIVTVPVDDGVEFRPTEATARLIREQDVYAAVGVAMPATVATAEVTLKVDVNVGDPVTPAPVELAYPALLDEPFTLVGYPLETVLAEKLVTMIDRGDTTTRDRDFADVWLVTRRHPIAAAPLLAAITATAQHRDVTLVPIADVLTTLATDRQGGWRRYTERAGLTDDVPPRFADPILEGRVTDASWGPGTSRWPART
jgi:predicted nucleotidyltransferase component of viral defense system